MTPAALATESVISIAAVGDIMMGTTYPEPTLPPNDGAGIFDAVENYFVPGDIVFGNLEGPLIDNGKTGKCRKNSTMCFAFSTPTRYAKYLKDAGFNVLNLANNHSFDFGDGGMKSTIAELDALSIKAVSGSRIARLDIRGRKVSVVGFSFSSPSPYSITDIAAARQVVTDLKASGDIVVVSFHGGAEGKAALKTPDAVEYFAGENRGNCIGFSRAMVDAGADLVLGHGPHILRPMELYKNRLIVYSLGNFLTFGKFNIREENGISMILKVDINRDNGEFAGGKIIPLKLIERGIPVHDTDKNAINLVRELSSRDIGRGNLIITAEGMLEKGDRPDNVVSSPVR
ncbi:MAG TPA: CapA family protein [Dissulfurispiraceae bacterium]|nr:CapA family protein [Dissulfurispiraceae bacterium]